jgi:hypothetical protein
VGGGGGGVTGYEFICSGPKINLSGMVHNPPAKSLDKDPVATYQQEFPAILTKNDTPANMIFRHFKFFKPVALGSHSSVTC